MNEEQLEQLRQLIRQELQILFGSDKFVFQKSIQISDGKNIQLGKTTGNSFGTEITQKISLYGVTPVIQASAISSPSAEVNSLKTAVDAIRVAQTNIGITA